MERLFSSKKLGTDCFGASAERHLDNLNAEKNMEILNCCGKETDRVECYSSDKTLDTANFTGDYGDLVGGEPVKKSKPLIKSPEKGDHRIIDLNDFGHQDGSRSPISKESSYWLKHDKDDSLSRHSDCTSKKVKSKQKLEPEVDERKGSANNNQYISPRSLREKHIEAAQSSSCEVGNKDHTVSNDHTSGRLYDQLQETDADENIQLSRSERRIKERNNSDHERHSKYGSLDKCTSRSLVIDKGAYKEREGSLYGKSDVHDSRHSSRDRGRDGSHDRGRDRVDRRHGSQDGGHEVVRHSNGYRDMDSKRSHSSSRHDERENKRDHRYKERDRDREGKKHNTKDIERRRERDRSRDRFRESEKNRNVRGESERGRDGTDRETTRIKDKKTNSHTDRERVDEREKYRRSNHDRQRDSRQSKHEDAEYRKDRIRAKTSTFNSHDFEEEKQNSLG